MKLSKTLLALLTTGMLSCGIFSQQAQATAINGNIQFAGEVKFDTNSLATATKVGTWYDVFHNAGFSSVTSGTGDLGGIVPGTQATMGATLGIQSIDADSGFVERWWFYFRSPLVHYRDSECFNACNRGNRNCKR
jgi:hypothetical protein